MGLFNDGMTQAQRERTVIDMLGHAPVDYESEPLRRFAAELLRKAERRAEDWLNEEIAEVMRGKAARKYVQR